MKMLIGSVQNFYMSGKRCPWQTSAIFNTPQQKYFRFNQKKYALRSRATVQRITIGGNVYLKVLPTHISSDATQTILTKCLSKKDYEDKWHFEKKLAQSNQKVRRRLPSKYSANEWKFLQTKFIWNVLTCVRQHFFIFLFSNF